MCGPDMLCLMLSGRVGASVFQAALCSRPPVQLAVTDVPLSPVPPMNMHRATATELEAAGMRPWLHVSHLECGTTGVPRHRCLGNMGSA